MALFILNMKKKKTSIWVCFFLFITSSFLTNSVHAGDVTIIDSRHYSNVFGEMRNYRIFLPPGYYDTSPKRYPVIYFLHGWAQRYFGSAGNDYTDYDKGEDNKGDNIANFVASYDVIVVKSDGYNRTLDEPYDLIPYNIGVPGEVDTYRQFPIYYPELVNYIDATYRTIDDREHRAISGLSMGGFMSFWIGGKYPQLFSAVGSFCGSPEFMVGPLSIPVEYCHKDIYENYSGINVRLNYGNKDFIRSYHEDLNSVWTQVMDHYDYKIYDAEHSTCGLGEMFTFFLNTFRNPPDKPSRWAHIDIYPEFSIWNYDVNSDRGIPGFTILENVDKSGFRFSIREFLPDGELMPFVHATVTTSPIYEKDHLYRVNELNLQTHTNTQKNIRSDDSGRLKIETNGSIQEIGICEEEDRPNIGLASFSVDNKGWATNGKDARLSLKFFNKGFAAGRSISAKIYATRNTTEIINGESTFGDININQIQGCDTPFIFLVKSDSIEIVKLKLIIQDDHKNKWTEFFEIPVKKDLLDIYDFMIADGKKVKVANAGIDIEDTLLGSGNGDGVANPGESIVILVKDKGIYRRTSLSFSDNYLNPFGVNIRRSDNWNKYDDVGGSNKYSLPLIASNCPENHNMEFIAEYWHPDSLRYTIKSGRIELKVKGKDTTPPQFNWVQIPGDNIIQTKLYDGSRIQRVKATLISKNNPIKYFDFELNDNGLNGDNEANDNVFSSKIQDQKFGFYRVIITATDSFGNNLKEEYPNAFILH